jgi:hypothetical protein
MKLVVLCAVAALIVGGVYHKEVSQYFADHTAGASQSGGTTSVVNSIQGMGNSSNALMGGVNNALSR